MAKSSGELMLEAIGRDISWITSEIHDANAGHTMTPYQEEWAKMARYERAFLLAVYNKCEAIQKESDNGKK